MQFLSVITASLALLASALAAPVADALAAAMPDDQGATILWGSCEGVSQTRRQLLHSQHDYKHADYSPLAL